MARFKLEDGKETEDLGKTVLSIAEEVGGDVNILTRDVMNTHQDQVRALVAQGFQEKIQLVYDTAETVHVVIPYLGGETYSDNNLANQAMGTIVIMGCAS